MKLLLPTLGLFMLLGSVACNQTDDIRGNGDEFNIEREEEYNQESLPSEDEDVEID